MTETIRLTAGRMFRSLHIPNYRRYFIAQTVSMTGTWLQAVAQIWLVLSITGSPVALGITSALQFAPMLLFGAWGGVIADRFDKRRILMITQVLAAVIALALGILTVTGIVTLWMVYVLTALWGVVIMIDNPTRQSFVSELVDPEHLSNAVGLNSTVLTAARTAGPAIAGILISTVGIGICFLLNALSYIVVVGALAKMDVDELHQTELVPRGKGQLREGFRYIWANPVLRSTLLLMAVVGTLAFNFRMFVPLLADKVFSGNAATFGLLSAMMGVGTIFGALASAATSRPTRKLLLASALTFGAFLVALGLAPTLTWAMVIIVPMGAASILFAATANSTLQMEAAPAMRGRVMALYAVVFLGSTPVGGPLMGYVAEHMGTRAALALSGVATLVAATFALRKRLRREAAGVMRRAGNTLSTRRDARRPASRNQRAGEGRRSAPRLSFRRTRRSGDVPEPRPDHRSSSSSGSQPR
ncbi:MAG: MFS transporter [Actinobacteria bacterium]|nr:MFS transporter [Actinomycetota bacterium]